MKYTTTDVDVRLSAPGLIDATYTSSTEEELRTQTGILRPGITPTDRAGGSPLSLYDQIINRRSYRNVLMCLAVLERLMYAHWHYSVMVKEAHDAGSDTRALQASLEVKTDSTSWFKAFDGYDEPGRRYTASEVFQMTVARSYWYTSDLHALLKRLANLGGASAFSREAAEDMLVEYGLDIFMNPDDPFGPDSGILGPGDPDSTIYDAATLPISTLLD